MQNRDDTQKTNCDEMESKFYEIIRSSRASRKDFSKEKLDKYIAILLNENENRKKESLDYYINRHFSVKKYKDKYVLIDKKHMDGEDVIPFLYFEEIFDTLKTAHINCHHGGVKKTFRKCKSYAANIKIDHVKAFISICKNCINVREMRSKKRQRSILHQKIKSSQFGERGQADLIDIQRLLNDYKIADRRCRFILNYQDHFTKFCFLRGLKNKKPHSIIEGLKSIFFIIGAPKIFQTDNGGEFVNDSLKRYMALAWPKVTMIRGRPYHPESQGSVERANGDVKRMLNSFFSHNSDMSIFNVIDYIQYQKNTDLNRCLGKSPYEIVFGRQPSTTFDLRNIIEES